MEKLTQFNIKITRQEHDAWVSRAKEEAHGNMTQFIRNCVEQRFIKQADPSSENSILEQLRKNNELLLKIVDVIKKKTDLNQAGDWF